MVNGAACVRAHAYDAARGIQSRAVRTSASCHRVAFLTLIQGCALCADVADAKDIVGAQLSLDFQAVLVGVRRPEVRRNDGLVQERRRRQRQSLRCQTGHAARGARIAECGLKGKCARDVGCHIQECIVVAPRVAATQHDFPE